MVLLVHRWWEQWNRKFYLLIVPVTMMERVSDMAGEGFSSMCDIHSILSQGYESLFAEDAIQTRL